MHRLITFQRQYINEPTPLKRSCFQWLIIIINLSLIISLSPLFLGRAFRHKDLSCMPLTIMTHYWGKGEGTLQSACWHKSTCILKYVPK